MTVDYRKTVFLPKTSFPMKAGLPQREPKLVAQWKEMGMYKKLREAAAGREKYILHDGPPYANGHLHMGHALNKVLKDIIVRSRQMLGYDSNYVPGWDCHGLPIEWQIEQAYRKKNRHKDEVPADEFRRECRDFAQKWVDIQSEEFRRLGVEGDWDNPYTTMNFQAEAGIFRELSKFLMNGSLYRGKKSVMWSPVEKTALAEAEVEYEDIVSQTIYVAFTPKSVPDAVFDGARPVIWTTTPWTMPSNRAIAYGVDIDYLVIEVTAVDEESWVSFGDKLIIADALSEDVLRQTKITGHDVVHRCKGSALAGMVCAHPLAGQGFEFDVPLLAGDFVTTETGTGLVHIAPSHGVDDFNLGMEHGLEVPDSVNEDGTYADWMPLFAGGHVYKAADPVCDKLREAGGLLARGTLYHSYPHSWRSKKPLIFRATPQWFVPMEGDLRLRETALKAIDETAFFPASGQKRLRSMIEHRPDWCLSRQRAWGVPIAVFVHRESGEPLRDDAVNDRIARAFEEHGADAWFTMDPATFLGPDRDPDNYEQVRDILDVWFDSGSTHATVLEQRDDLKSPASLYLEGSDQHRGWFHSSLLESCGTRGRAPYEAVLTHGFVLDAKGEKMSKSRGNVIVPADILKEFGADILRLWVATADYSDDLRVGKEILKGQADSYRRLRNTLRFLLGNLADFSDAEHVEPADMPELERWVLHRLSELDQMIRSANDVYDFSRIYTTLHHFCAMELSAFYFDIRKDTLYCNAAGSIERRSARTVLDILFRTLTSWLAPVLVFTMEEAWRHRYGEAASSIHLELFPDIPADWRDDALGEKWQRLRTIRRVVTGALEVERREKRIGSSLEAAPVIHVPEDDAALLATINVAELSITSGADITTDKAPEEAWTLDDVSDVAVMPAKASGHKCARCWQILEEVESEDSLCRRCTDAVSHHDAAAA